MYFTYFTYLLTNLLFLQCFYGPKYLAQPDKTSAQPVKVHKNTGPANEKPSQCH